MRLSSLLSQLPHQSVDGDTSCTIESVHHDSRRVGPKDIFVAIQGAVLDGRRFTPNLDAAAIISDSPIETMSGVCCIRVKNTRLALAQCAAILARHPAKSLPVVGITGTNGKTTTAWILEQLLQVNEFSAGVIGTLSHRSNGVTIQTAQHTTPEASKIQPLLAAMRDQGCHCAIMEVSSIGLDLHRVAALPFQIAVFTNFSRDHLDFHKTLDGYFAAKKRLFTDLLAQDGVAVVNVDDPKSKDLIDATPSSITYGLDQACDYRFTKINNHNHGFIATLEAPSGPWKCKIPLSGRHNLYNLLAAIVVAKHLGCSLNRIVDALPDLKPAPGRLEPVLNGAPFQVFTDYAHTPDALEHVLKSIKVQCRKRVILVFGCGGDRDQGKRQPMGRIAEENADIVIVTSDNPRSESPEKIIDDICLGMSNPTRISNRREAIRKALELANEGDIVVVAGKGHEHYQEIDGVRHPFDDRAVAQNIYSEMPS